MNKLEQVVTVENDSGQAKSIPNDEMLHEGVSLSDEVCLLPQVLGFDQPEQRLIVSLTVRGDLDENFVSALVDTGAQISLVEEDFARYMLDNEFAVNLPVQNKKVRGLTGLIQISQSITTTLLLQSGHVLSDITLLVVGCNTIGSPLLLGADIIVKFNLEPNLFSKALYIVESDKTLIKTNSETAEKFQVIPIKTENETSCEAVYIASTNIVLEPLTYTKVNVQLEANQSIPLNESCYFESILKKSQKCQLLPGLIFSAPVLDVYLANLTSNSLRLKSGTPVLSLRQCTPEEVAESENFSICLNLVSGKLEEDVCGTQSGDSQWTLESLAESFGISANTLLDSARSSELAHLLYRYRPAISLGDHDVGTTKILKHEINLTTSKPVWVPVRRFQGDLAEEIHKECQYMLKEGIIRPSNSPYSAPIVPIRKKCGGLRLAIDYRAINKITVVDKFPLPNITDMVYALHGANYFSSLDLVKGFFNMEMQEESIPYTAFSSTRGHFEWNKMPFGLVNSPASFQRCMLLALSALPRNKCFIYLDDILIVSATLEEHFVLLEALLVALQQAGLKINPKKCNLITKNVDFLGYQVSAGGISPLKKNVDAILDYPVPKTIRDLRRFLGMCNYFRKHIDNMATIAKPLTEVTGSNKLCWTSGMQHAFEKLKHKLGNPPILSFPDSSPQAPPLLLQVDASGIGAGAVLLQERDGLRSPIAYISMSFSPPVCRYSVTERELTAMRWAIKSLRPFLLGNKFIVLSDHQPLVYLQNMKLVDNRIARTLEDLAPYNFEVQYLPGRDNVVGDALSRAPLGLSSQIPEVQGDHYLPPNSSIVLMPGGGNSLFQALSTALYGSDSQHLELREKCIDELAHRPLKYNLIKQTKELRRMRISGQYVIFEALQAFANINKCNILVYFGTKQPLAFVGDRDGERKIYLQSLSGMHFNLIRIGDLGEKPNIPDARDWFFNDVDDELGCTALAECSTADLVEENMEDLCNEVEPGAWWFSSEKKGRLVLHDTHEDPWVLDNFQVDDDQTHRLSNVVAEEECNLVELDELSAFPCPAGGISALPLVAALTRAQERDLQNNNLQKTTSTESSRAVSGEAIETEQAEPISEEEQNLLLPYLSVECIQNIQQSDLSIGTLVSVVRGETDFPLNPSDELCLFFKWIGKLKLVNNILIRETKHGRHYVISEAHLIQLAVQLHIGCGHAGRDKLFNLIIPHLWHPLIRNILSDMVTSCPKCQIYKASSGTVVTPPTMRIQSLYPYNLVTVDLLELPPSTSGYKYVLALIDHFSKFISLAPLRRKTSKEVSAALRNRILGTLVAAPQLCAGDSGPEFRAGEFKELLEEFGIRQTRSPPRSPWVAGQVERSNRTIIQLLRLLSTSGDKWPQELVKVAIQMNYTYQDTLKMSPSQYLLTKRHATPIGPSLTMEQQLTWSPGSPKFDSYAVGDLVLRKNIHTGNKVVDKFSPKYLGPHRITQVFSHGVSYLMTDTKTGKQGKSHFRHLKRFCEIPQYLLNNMYYVNSFLKPLLNDVNISSALPDCLDLDNLVPNNNLGSFIATQNKVRKQSAKSIKLEKMRERLIPGELCNSFHINPDGGLDMIDEDLVIVCPQTEVSKTITTRFTQDGDRNVEKTHESLINCQIPVQKEYSDPISNPGVEGGEEVVSDSLMRPQSCNDTCPSNTLQFIDYYAKKLEIATPPNKMITSPSSLGISLEWDSLGNTMHSFIDWQEMSNLPYTGDTGFYIENRTCDELFNSFSNSRLKSSSPVTAVASSSTLAHSRPLSASPSVSSPLSNIVESVGELHHSTNDSDDVPQKSLEMQELFVGTKPISPLVFYKRQHPYSICEEVDYVRRLTRSTKIDLPAISLPSLPLEYKLRRLKE